MTRSLLQLMARPIGPDTPLISFDEFLRKLEPLNPASLAAGLTTFSWRAWRGEFPTDEANSLSIALAAHMAVLALAKGTVAGREPTPSEIADLHFRYLAIDSTSNRVFDPIVLELANLAVGSPAAVMLPDLGTAGIAVGAFTIARIFRVQWLPARTRFDELSRTWWIARRLDAEAAQLVRAEQMLGMSVPTFVRAASALIALAVTSEPEMGRVDLNRPIDQAFTEKYDVDADALRLAAYKLATSRDDLQLWLDDLVRNAPPGLLHYAPTPLASTPLLRGDDLVDPKLPSHTLFLCPSIYHFIGAVRDRVKDAISAPGQITEDTQTLYGEMLNRYVARCIEGTGRVINIDDIDGNDRRADWLLVADGCGLIIEVKRVLATGALSRHLVTARGMAAVLEHLYGAYDQCRSTRSGARWTTQCGRLSEIAALVLVDEPVGAEGAVVSDLLARQTVAGVDPPFEVMSVAEFENAIHVLGVKQLVRLINEKWQRGYVGVPLGVYFTKVLGREKVSADGARKYLEDEDRELFLELGLSASAFGAEWPL